MKKANKKGVQMSQLPQLIMVLVVVGGLALGGFVTWTALAAAGDDDGNVSTTSQATYFLNNVSLMVQNLGGQLPTIGTIIGVGLLIATVVGAFVVGRSKGLI